METKHLKKYAPEARRDFIAAVKNKAAVYGLLPKQILPMKEEGDVVIIGDRPFPRTVAKQRNELETRIRKEGFQQFIEAVAYTWFNRFVAIRYMELHGYLDHGYRVLSHPEGKSAPEILENAERVELPGLKRDEVVDLKLDGGKDEQLYHMLLLAQCNALHKAMPFLFESIKDGTELLLPDNLLHTDSLVRTLVNDIPDEQWENVEIIGWLYQFYISEKKDEVIGKVVKSEDIPAATQLFTPNWIVKYLVQNSLGRQWMATYPNSPLKQQMEFYIEPAEQTPEVQRQLDEITPDSLNPEELTLLDPACGSGHILVEAYDLFKGIYEERGYRARDIPKLILTKNLFGLEIDDRAAQLAAFSLMMKARTDDRGIFERSIQPNVLAIQESKTLDADDITEALNEPVADERGEVGRQDIEALIQLFVCGKTFGSLLRVPEELAERLPQLASRVAQVAESGGLLQAPQAKRLSPFVRQAVLLSGSYNVVLANPPYLNRNAMTNELKEFVAEEFPEGKADLFAAFVLRDFEFADQQGRVGHMSPFVWMFLKSYEGLRKYLIGESAIESLIRPEYHAFFDSAYVPICAFVVARTCRSEAGEFFDLSEFYGAELQPTKFLEALSDPRCGWRFSIASTEFLKIPGAPIAYWVHDSVRIIFEKSQSLSDIADTRQGLATGKNELFLRFWHEVNWDNTEFGCGSHEDSLNSSRRWYPCNKGGPFRRWFGNNDYVVNWEANGRDLKAFKPRSVIRNESYYFRQGITWSTISSSSASFRHSDSGRLFESKGAMCFPKSEADHLFLMAFLNSCVVNDLLKISSPTLDFHEGPVGRLPVVSVDGNKRPEIDQLVLQAIDIAKEDDSEDELSYRFVRSPLLGDSNETVESSLKAFEKMAENRRASLQQIETTLNSLFIDAYGLCEHLSPDVAGEDISIRRPETQEETARLVSYALGCCMGRYSLDEPGLMYAHCDNEGFGPSKYKSFPADEDGIVPITDTAWFPDDAANRFEEFIKAVWPEEHLEENLKFIAGSLDQKKGETSRDCIRRYLATGFYKHHMSMYKKRPIYWLFSSGKQRAFQCLVYLHRYNAGTLSRMRTEYVVKLQGKINARIEQLESDIPSAGSTSHRKKLEKERDTLIKQREELQTFDEKLRHYADQRIELDLDDGVKVNYGKFGDLLAEVKAITGEKPKVEVVA